ncbi:MAG: DUF4157 domain-containing protein [Bacteroidota bacterium]|nr:DUF4157 domain-containing protein [Bacteroidota bacterium]
MDVSQPGDQSEVQADEVAGSFMLGDAEDSQHILSQPTINVSRMGEGEGMETSNEFDQQLQSSKGQGHKLDEGTKSELEEHMGKDLSGVNIHTDEKAQEMSEDINAKAFAHGGDIYFKEGNYNPESEEGKELLVHEVAHVVQQENWVQAKIQRIPITIEFYSPYDIEAGDAGKLAIRAMVQTVFSGIYLNDSELQFVVDRHVWKTQYSGSKKGALTSVSSDTDYWIRDLIEIYTKLRPSPNAVKLIESYKDSAAYHGLAGIMKLAEIADMASRMSDEEFEVYQKLPFSMTSDIMEVTSGTMEDVMFGDKDLYSKENISIYLSGTVQQNRKKLQENADIFLTISIEKYKEMSAWKSYSDQKIAEVFNVEGLRSPSEFETRKELFLQYFQDYTLGKAFLLLDANYAVLTSEQERYKSDVEIDELIKAFTTGKVIDKYNEADVQRSKALKQFLDDFEIDDFGVGIINKGRGLSHSDSVEYITDVFHNTSTYDIAIVNGILYNWFMIFDDRYPQTEGKKRNKQLLNGVKKMSPKMAAEFNAAIEYWKNDPKYAANGNKIHIMPDLILRLMYNDYPGWIEAWNLDRLATTIADEELVKKYPYLTNVSADFRTWNARYKLGTMDIPQLRKAIRDDIDTKIANNRSAKNKLSEKPEKVWNLHELIPSIIDNDLNYDIETTPGYIISEKQLAIQREEELFTLFLVGVSSDILIVDLKLLDSHEKINFMKLFDNAGLNTKSNVVILNP